MLLAVFLEKPPSGDNFTPQIWLSLFYLALPATALAYIVHTSAQTVLSAAQTSMLFITEAIFASFFGWLILDEMLLPRQFLGAAIMLVSIIGILLLPSIRAVKKPG